MGVCQFLSCRQPLKDTHDEFIKDQWKQTLGSEIHCVAGDATAIIITAAILYYYFIPNGTEAIIEYIAAYLFGLFIFQALFMRGMFSSYMEAVKKTIFVETVSMNMVMAGMIPTIVVIKYFYPLAANPSTLYFWGMMSIATIIGFIFAYPINSWMVKKRLKHEMMSMGMHHHQKPRKISLKKQWQITLGTFVFLLLVCFVVNFFVPIRFY